jgi:hypothetical protein
LVKGFQRHRKGAARLAGTRPQDDRERCEVGVWIALGNDKSQFRPPQNTKRVRELRSRQRCKKTLSKLTEL